MTDERMRASAETAGTRAYVYGITATTWIMILIGSTALATVLTVTTWSASAVSDEVALSPEFMAKAMSQPHALQLGVLLNCTIMLVAGGLGVRFAEGETGPLWARLGFARLAPLSLLMVVLGTLGLGAALESSVYFLDLRDEGSLGMLHRALGALSGAELWSATLVLGIGPGLAEEVFFRGFMLGRLLKGESVLVSLLASSIAFGLFHFDGVHTPTAALLGLYLGAAVVLTRSLWSAVLAHAVNNSVATLLAGLTLGPKEHGLVLGAGLVCATFALRYVYRLRGSTGPVHQGT